MELLEFVLNLLMFFGIGVFVFLANHLYQQVKKERALKGIVQDVRDSISRLRYMGYLLGSVVILFIAKYWFFVTDADLSVATTLIISAVLVSITVLGTYLLSDYLKKQPKGYLAATLLSPPDKTKDLENSLKRLQNIDHQLDFSSVSFKETGIMVYHDLKKHKGVEHLFKDIPLLYVQEQSKIIFKDLQKQLNAMPFINDYTVKEMTNMIETVQDQSHLSKVWINLGLIAFNPIRALFQKMIAGFLTPAELLKHEVLYWLHAQLYATLYQHLSEITDKKKQIQNVHVSLEIEPKKGFYHKQVMKVAKEVWLGLWVFVSFSLIAHLVFSALVLMSVAVQTASILPILVVFVAGYGLYVGIKEVFSLSAWRGFIADVAKLEKKHATKLNLESELMKSLLMEHLTKVLQVCERDYSQGNQFGQFIQMAGTSTWQIVKQDIEQKQRDCCDDLDFYLSDLLDALYFWLEDSEILLADYLNPASWIENSAYLKTFPHFIEAELLDDSQIIWEQSGLVAKAKSWLVDKVLEKANVHATVANLIVVHAGLRMAQVLSHNVTPVGFVVMPKAQLKVITDERVRTLVGNFAKKPSATPCLPPTATAFTETQEDSKVSHETTVSQETTQSHPEDHSVAPKPLPPKVQNLLNAWMKK